MSLVYSFSEIEILLFFTLACMPCWFKSDCFEQMTSLLESILHVNNMSGSSEDRHAYFFQGHCFEKALENKPSSIFLLLPNQMWNKTLQDSPVLSSKLPQYSLLHSRFAGV